MSQHRAYLKSPSYIQHRPTPHCTSWGCFAPSPGGGGLGLPTVPPFAENPPSSVIGRWLRRLGGGTDALSALNSRDRLTYTTSGLVVLTASALSSMTMASALAVAVPEAPWPVVVIGAAVWALTLANLDHRLPANFIGRRARKLRLALPRLLMAVLLGSVIGEPLVLRIFRTSIEARSGSTETGLLDQLVTLDALAQENPAISAAAWALRLLFMVIISLPVLVRLLRRRTVQDDVFEYMFGTSRASRPRSHLRLVERTPSGKQTW